MNNSSKHFNFRNRHSKGKSLWPICSDVEYIKKTLLIKNAKESFDCLLEIVDELTIKYGRVHRIVGMELTGYYWENIAYYLKIEA